MARDLDLDFGSGHMAYSRTSHHASTSTYIQNLIEIEETFCEWTDLRTYVRAYVRTSETNFIRSTQKSDQNTQKAAAVTQHLHFNILIYNK